MLANGSEVGKAYSDPEEFENRTRQHMEEVKLGDYIERTKTWMPLVRGGFLGLSLIVTLGGVSMVRQRWHGLAMLGSIASLFNVAGCCCVVGLPAGGWALYVLMNPEVRAQFLRPLSGGARKSAPLD
jgi:hypothetical protein